MNIAVIPARIGSKRIPHKNIKLFNNKPIIRWPIENAINSKLFDHIIVSTDDNKIAKIAKSCGAEVFFMRPESLSDDFIGTTEVIGHAVSWMKNQKWELDLVCCIYATAVFFTKNDINKGLEAFENNDLQYAFSATSYPSTIYRSFIKQEGDGVEMIFPENFNKRSQDLPIALHDAAQFYWGKPKAWENELQIFSKYSKPILIPNWRIQDIDTEDDWHRAELLYKLISKDKNEK
jgi:pseudaminic acid cytidylyltransferase